MYYDIHEVEGAFDNCPDFSKPFVVDTDASFQWIELGQYSHKITESSPTQVED